MDKILKQKAEDLIRAEVVPSVSVAISKGIYTVLSKELFLEQYPELSKLDDVPYLDAVGLCRVGGLLIVTDMFLSVLFAKIESA